MATTITNAAGLDDIRLNLAGDYVLGDNIDLSGIASWEPIGTPLAPFTGTLDLAGHEITNLLCDRGDYAGLFGYCRFNNPTKIPNIKNGTVSGAVSGQDYVGLIAGYVETTLGSTGIEGTDPPVGVLAESLAAHGTVQGRSRVGAMFGMVAGPKFAGHKNKQEAEQTVFADWIARLEKVSSSADVVGSGSGHGGIVGELREICITNTSTTGTVNGERAGGIVGYGYRFAVDQAITTGDITGQKIAGGIVGFGTYRAKLTRCRTEGDITGTAGSYPGMVQATAAGVGGIAGYLDIDQMYDCCSYGDITAVYRAGGLVGSGTGGLSSPNFKRCYSRGKVQTSHLQVGGLIGFLFTARTIVFTQCYHSGEVVGGQAGALIGVRGSYVEWDDDWIDHELLPQGIPGEVVYHSDCFFNSDLVIASDQYGGIGRTTAELRLDATYEEAENNWQDYDRYWIIDDEEGDWYPQLLCFYDPYGLTIDLTMGPDGLVFSYLKDGKLFYRQLDGTWEEPGQVAGIENAQTMTAFRTKDEQLGWVVDENGRLKYILDNAIHNITAGYYGNILDAEDEAFLLYVTNNGAIAQLAGQGDWPIAFTDAKPIPSDSQISRLRAGAYGKYAYAAWRSRGQHRLMILATAGALPERYLIRSGTMTMMLSSPVVSVQLEVDEEVEF